MMFNQTNWISGLTKYFLRENQLSLSSMCQSIEFTLLSFLLYVDCWLFQMLNIL